MCKTVLTGSQSSTLKQHHEGTGPGERRGQSLRDVGRRHRKRPVGALDGRPGRQKVNNELLFRDWGRLLRDSELISFCSRGNKA